MVVVAESVAEIFGMSGEIEAVDLRGALIDGSCDEHSGTAVVDKVAGGHEGFDSRRA